VREKSMADEDAGLRPSDEEFIDERSRVYGEPVDCWSRVAQVWSGVLDAEVSAADAVLCMIALKLVRTAITPDYSDNSTDIGGYLEIFRRIIGDDMIEASTVDEYVVRRPGSYGDTR
jgi:hypothetical protein